MGDREKRLETARAAQDADVEQADASPDRMRQAAMVKRKATAPTNSGSALDPVLRAKMEKSLGSELSGVRVHTDGDAATRSKDLGARAYTEGADVHFGAGEYNPGTKEGDRLIAHELTHVVQGGMGKGGPAPSAHAGGGGAAAARKADGAEAASDEKEGAEVEVSDPEEDAEKEADAVADQTVDKQHGDEGKESEGAEAQGEMGAEGAEKKDEPPKIQAKLDGAARKVYRWQDYTEKDDKGRKSPEFAGPEKSVEQAGQYSGVSKDKQAQAAKIPPAKLLELEAQIGQSAYGKGKGTADQMMGAIRGKLSEEVELQKAKGSALEGEALRNDVLIKSCGYNPKYDPKGVAGAIANNAALLEQTMSKGSLREQMTIAMNFQSAFPKMMVGQKDAEAEAEAKGLEDKGTEVTQMADKVKALPEVASPATGAPAKEGVESAEFQQLGSRELNKGGERVQKPTAGELEAKGMGLSVAELQMMFGDKLPPLTDEEKADPAKAKQKLLAAVADQQVTWALGINKWAERKHSEFGEKLASLNMPFGAGPSGTTSRICESAVGLGIAPNENLRAACLGYLLPISAHSLWEIVEGAKTQGIAGPDFAAEGVEAYLKLKPFEGEAAAFLEQFGVKPGATSVDDDPAASNDAATPNEDE